MTGKITWARPMGALLFAFTVLMLYAYDRPVPDWAMWASPLMLMTWFIDRSLWKLFKR